MAEATVAQRWAGQPGWFEIKQGMVFEVLRHGPVGSRWIVLDPRFDGPGAARMARLDDHGQVTAQRDTVWWSELFDDARLVSPATHHTAGEQGGAE